MERTLKSLLLGGQRIIENRGETLYEIHYRVPRLLTSPFIASHFTQVNKSAEDTFFEKAVERAKKIFSESTFIKIDILTFDKESWKILFKNKYSGHYGTESQIIEDVNNVKRAITDSYVNLLKNKPELFIFGACDYIVQLIARDVMDSIGQSRAADIILDEFVDLFRDFFRKNLNELFNELQVDYKDIKIVRHNELGGMVTWIASHSKSQINDDINKKIRPSAMNQEKTPSSFKPYDDFAHYYIESKSPFEEVNKLFEYQVRWSRFPQAWTYTFIESIKKEGRTSTEAITTFLLSWSIDPSVFNSTAFSSPPINREFPGFIFSGAHYLMLSVNELISFCISNPANLVPLDQKPANSIKKLRNLNLSTMENSAALENISIHMHKNFETRKSIVIALIKTCIEVFDWHSIRGMLERHSCNFVQKNEMKSILDKHTPNSIIKADNELAVDLVNYLSSANVIALDPAISFLGSLVTSTIESDKISEARKVVILEKIAQVTEEFWKSTVGVNIEKELDAIASDYVCSAMVDKKCLYFSNFLPMGKEQFTRTIFVDIGLNAHQRARLLQRLCDLLTYRSLPIRDLSRVRAAVEALNELNRSLNRIQMKLMEAPSATEGEEVENIKSHEEERQKGIQSQLKSLHTDLADIIRISSISGKMNSFITSGISGKAKSASDYMSQILERCEDLREERIPGYPLLSDFVQRRLADSVRSIERMNIHHETVNTRVAGLMDRVRTQLNALQTDEIINNLAIQTRAGATLTLASEHVQQATLNITSNLREQVRLTKAADVLVMLGGSYYTYQLLTSFLKWAYGDSSYDWNGYLILSVIFIVLAVRRYIDVFVRIEEWVTELLEKIWKFIIK